MTKLKKLREEIGLTQTAVARRLNLSRRHYQRFENEPDDYKLTNERKKEIAKIFNCSVAEISQEEA
jgi:DNA-binding XRE family transcriptional regulator